jgi:hypothetical protein
VLTLSNLTHSPSSIHWWGPTQVLDEQVLRRLSDLLHSGDTETLKWACNILGNLVVHHSTSVLALGVRLCERIEPLLRYFHCFDGCISLIVTVMETAVSASVHYMPLP